MVGSGLALTRIARPCPLALVRTQLASLTGSMLIPQPPSERVQMGILCKGRKGSTTTCMPMVPFMGNFSSCWTIKETPRPKFCVNTDVNQVWSRFLRKRVLIWTSSKTVSKRLSRPELFHEDVDLLLASEALGITSGLRLW